MLTDNERALIAQATAYAANDEYVITRALLNGLVATALRLEEAKKEVHIAGDVFADTIGASLVLPFPPSVNRLYRNVNGRTIISADGRKYCADVAACLPPGGAPLTQRLAVSIQAHAPDGRRRDLDNLQKALLDALTKASVWADDSQIDCLFITRGKADKGNPRVIVNIYAMQD